MVEVSGQYKNTIDAEYAPPIVYISNKPTYATAIRITTTWWIRKSGLVL